MSLLDRVLPLRPSTILSPRSAFGLIVGLGCILTGTILLDLFVDQALERDRFGLEAAEHLLPLLLAGALPYAGWRLLRGKRPALYLYSTALWSLVGCAGVVLISSFLFAVQIYQGEIEPRMIVVQLGTVGAGMGLLFGYSIARVREAEREAGVERARLSSLLDALPIPVVHGTFDQDRLEVETVNTAFEEVFGYEGPEVEGADLNQVVVPEQQQEEAVEIDRQAVEQGVVDAEVRRQTARGPRYFHLRATRARRGHRPETYAVYTDITEQKRRKQQLIEAKNQAEEASKLKTAMLANMSHEVRTPLTSISGFAEILQKELEGKAKRFAARIQECSSQLQRTLETIMQVSKLEAGAEELELEPLPLGPVVEEVVEVVEESDVEGSPDITTAIADEEVFAHANEDAARRIFRNILENAIKFTPEEGHVEVRVSAEGDHAVLEVEDSGIGMDPDKVSELFEAFKQESEGPDREYEGSGLGLSIVKRLTDEMDGRVDVDTEKGEGTCVTVRLPRP